MSGKQGLRQLEQIKERNLSLQKERQSILRSVDLPEDYLTEPFTCRYAMTKDIETESGANALKKF